MAAISAVWMLWCLGKEKFIVKLQTKFFIFFFCALVAPAANCTLRETLKRFVKSSQHRYEKICSQWHAAWHVTLGDSQGILINVKKTEIECWLN